MYLLAAFILIAVVLMANMVNRWNVPLIIIALGMGIFFGSDVTGLIYFDDAMLTAKLATAALIFVLFAGGFDTKRDSIKSILGPSVTLATLGVLITAFATAGILCLMLRWDFSYALLVGAIISSTDAAAIFSILRTRSIQPRLASIINLESAANDPMAIISVTFLVEFLDANIQGPVDTILSLVWQLAGGVGLGVLIGYIGMMMLNKSRNVDRGYFYILLVGIVLLAFGLADVLKASGMLAVFFAGFVIGNQKFPYKRDVGTFVEALSTVSNVGLFVLLGLLVFPKEFIEIWKPGVVVFLVLLLVGRPLAVLLCTMFGKFNWKDRVFMSWSGIRGAVPIVLATYPLAGGVENSHQIFNIVFFAVTLSVLIQGTTIGKLAELLKLIVKAKPQSTHSMELVTILDSDLELTEIHIDEDFYTGQATVSMLDLPAEATITMINRKNNILAPRGATVLMPGDIIFVLASPKDIEMIRNVILGSFQKIDTAGELAV
jgi:cell volume regulation protein A